MGVVSWRWVWVEAIGVASWCVCKEFIDFLILLIPTFRYLFAAASLLFVHFKMFLYTVIPEINAAFY